MLRVLRVLRTKGNKDTGVRLLYEVGQQSKELERRRTKRKILAES